MTTATQYACISDLYDPGANPEPYESVEAFMQMCDACFGERPDLVERDGDYYEGDVCILEAVEVEVPREYGRGRDVRVEIRATEGERDSWDAAAGRTSLTRSEWIRMLANEAADELLSR